MFTLLPSDTILGTPQSRVVRDEGYDVIIQVSPCYRQQGDNMEMQLTHITTRYLIEKEKERVYSLISKPLLDKILCKKAFLAGGAVTYVLDERVAQKSIGDVDVFASHLKTLLDCAEAADDMLLGPKRYLRQTSTICIQSRKACPIQFILTKPCQDFEECIRETILSFDFDLVQCAISMDGGGELLAHYTRMAEMAYETGIIRYLLDYPYHPMRLVSRLAKAMRKGYKLPSKYRNIKEMGVDTYTPKHAQKDPLLECIRMQEPEEGEQNWTEIYDENRGQASNITVHTSLVEAIEIPFKTFTRDRYETDEDVKTVRVNEQLILNQTRKYIRLPSPTETAPPESENIRNGPKLLGKFERMVAHLKKNVDVMKGYEEDERRLFFLLRAYELVLEGKYQDAVSSAMSDQNKLYKGSDLGVGAFALGVEQTIYLENSKTGVTKELAIRTIERVLGKP